MSNPFVSWLGKYLLTFFISSASCGLFESSQNIAGEPVILALLTANFTQSLMAVSRVKHILQISPSSTFCSIILLPFASIIEIAPLPLPTKVCGCEPYSWAFLAISPTFETVPIVEGLKAPFSLQNSIVSS